MSYRKNYAVGIAAILAVVTMGYTRSARATNLLVNGNFARLTPAAANNAGAGISSLEWPQDWTVTGVSGSGTGNNWFFGIHTDDVNVPGVVGDNAMEAFQTTNTTGGTLSQTFSGMTVGTTYFFSYVYNSGDTVPSNFVITLAGGSGFTPPLPNASAFLSPTGWEGLFSQFTATSTTGTLTITMQDAHSNVEIGDLSVSTTNPFAQVVPLPASFYLSLPAAAIAGAYFIRRKMTANVVA